MTLREQILERVKTVRTNPSHWHPSVNLNQRMYRAVDIDPLIERLVSVIEQADEALKDIDAVGTMSPMNDDETILLILRDVRKARVAIRSLIDA